MNSIPSDNKDLVVSEEDLFLLGEFLTTRNKDSISINYLINYIRESTGIATSPDFENRLIDILANKIKYERNLSKDVEDFVLSTNGYFLSTDIERSLQLSTRNDKKNLSIILKRMAKRGILEKHGNKHGQWRVVDNSFEEIDFLNADDSGLDLKYPFYLEDYFVTQSKNICMVAGEPDAGKSALLLNFAELNMNKHNIYYFSSEMGGNELKSRLKRFNRPLESWRVKFIERSTSFEDVIKPNDINIIDFLEITSDFWRIGEHITNIFRKLDRGMAFIAIQKNKTKTFKDGTTSGEFGLGGQRGLEKPRLYLTMGNKDGAHVAKILKCKNWRHEDLNPNGMELEFSLRRGCEFIIKKMWEKNGMEMRSSKKRGYDLCSTDFVPED